MFQLSREPSHQYMHKRGLRGEKLWNNNRRLVFVTADTTCTTTIANMHSTTSMATRSHVLLKTSITQVSSDGKQFDTANILFDEGAQRSFITQEMANNLNLKPQKTESVTISGFGESNKKVRYLQVTTVYMKSLSIELIPIDVLIVPKIADLIQTYVRIYRTLMV